MPSKEAQGLVEQSGEDIPDSLRHHGALQIRPSESPITGTLDGTGEGKIRPQRSRTSKGTHLYRILPWTSLSQKVAIDTLFTQPVSRLAKVITGLHQLILLH